jgi:D-glycero-alpha-D-manno-heptose-7-phosphate kinase
MIITRAPLRISFLGGGTDIKEFYSKYPGRVISSSIDKFVYVVTNPNTFSNKFVLKYSETENVEKLEDIKHDRFRSALLKANIKYGVEIASFADLPSKTGLGSSSSFSVALSKALNAENGLKLSKSKAAEEACDLEIEILKEPIGKQDQYAASYGGLNVITFNTDGTVLVDPIYLDYTLKSSLESHLMLFFIGITRSAGDVLADQKKKIDDNFEIYKKMSDSVLEFRDKLVSGDFKGMGDMLHEGWMRKRGLGSSVTNSTIDSLYDESIKLGSWGGKLLGAGGGGCLLLMVPPEKQKVFQFELEKSAKSMGLSGFKRINFSLSSSGADVLFNSNNIL